MQDFRQLRVWQHAHALSLDIRTAVRTFPKSISRELKSQLIRAADSMASNIVEGCGAATRKEFARYLDISIKSASEVDYRLQLARDDGSLAHTDWHPLATQVVRIRKMLFGLRKSLLDAEAADCGNPRSDRPRTTDSEYRSPVMKRMTDDQRPKTND